MSFEQADVVIKLLQDILTLLVALTFIQFVRMLTDR